MRYLQSFVAVLVAAFAFPLIAQADTAAPRHLVYSFTWGTQSDLTSQESGMSASGTSSGSSGHSDYRGGDGDQGSILVDVVGDQPNHGLLVKVSEEAQHTRSAAQATCVVYGSTNVLCDPNKTVNPEEMTLLRFLGSNFVDPNAIDAKQHWQIRDSGAQYALQADYTIARNADGVMTIDETRVLKETQPATVTTDVTTTIGYDFTRTVPTAINEYSIQRSQGEMGQYQTVKTQTTLNLQTDSAATKKS